MLRIFTYLPNPRVAKAQIAARIVGVELEIRGDLAENLSNWLWDFEAREISASEETKKKSWERQGQRGFKTALYKTDEFLDRHPFGTIPAAFSSDGEIGYFESNSILRAVARSAENHDLYGRSQDEASRIDSFLDSGLVFAREVQVYLLDMEKMTTQLYRRMQSSYKFYLNGLERALSKNAYLCGSYLTLADISLVCDVVQFFRERDYCTALQGLGLEPISIDIATIYPHTWKYLISLAKQPEFSEPLKGLGFDPSNLMNS